MGDSLWPEIRPFWRYASPFMACGISNLTLSESIDIFLQDCELERAIGSQEGPGERKLQALWGAIQAWPPQVGGRDSSGWVEICGQEGKHNHVIFQFFLKQKLAIAIHSIF